MLTRLNRTTRENVQYKAKPKPLGRGGGEAIFARFSRYQKVLLTLLLFGFCSASFADFSHNGDLLAGTSDQLIATLKGSGKHYVYLAEGLLSLAAYIRTKNILVLFGIVVVAVFFNLILKISAG